MSYAEPAPPPRKRTGRVVLIVVAIVLVLCCGGAVGVTVLVNNVQDATGPAKASAASFLALLVAGETDTAYAELCPPTRAQFSAAEFAQIVNGRPKLMSYSIVGTNVGNLNGHWSGTVRALLQYPDGSSETHVLEMVKDSNDWRVCGNPY
jgi:flagellar basal body-associated protein FliL